MMWNIKYLNAKLEDILNNDIIRSGNIEVPVVLVENLTSLLHALERCDCVTVVRCKDCGYRHRDGTCLLFKTQVDTHAYCSFAVPKNYTYQEGEME